MSEIALLSVQTYRTSSAVSSLAFPELVAHLLVCPSPLSPHPFLGRALADTATKDITKHTRYALSDNAPPVQRVAAEVWRFYTLNVISGFPASGRDIPEKWNIQCY